MSCQVRTSPFGRTRDGRPVTRFDLLAPDGSGVALIDHGAVVLELRVPDRDGRLDNVVLGHAELAGYEANAPYFGALVGRCANRIAGAAFELDGERYRLPPNEGATHLHGGPDGFHTRAWEAAVEAADEGEAALTMRRTSPDGEAGYPGTLEVEARFAWTASHELRLRIEAVCDAPTPVNVAHHGYWNLTGEGAGTVDGHRLTVEADAYLPVDAGLIPSGEIAPVDGTPFDLRRGPAIGTVVRTDHPQVRIAGGVDHAFVLRGGGAGPRPVARLEDPVSGRGMTLRTDRPSLQVYTGNALDGAVVGRSGRRYRQGDGVALEPQGFPDALHHPSFPSVVLRPGERYRSESVFAFDAAG
jgi:aldose 1-epimerase